MENALFSASVHFWISGAFEVWGNDTGFEVLELCSSQETKKIAAIK